MGVEINLLCDFVTLVIIAEPWRMQFRRERLPQIKDFELLVRMRAEPYAAESPKLSAVRFPATKMRASGLYSYAIRATVSLRAPPHSEHHPIRA